MANDADSTASEEKWTGEFPFPIAAGPDESAYLKWLRNHSNYMVTRGFLDYLRIGAILLRGILLNLLILIPFLLSVSLVIGLIYGPYLRSSTIHWVDLPFDSLEDFSRKLKTSPQQAQPASGTQPVYRQRPIDNWVFDQLEEETQLGLVELFTPKAELGNFLGQAALSVLPNKFVEETSQRLGLDPQGVKKARWELYELVLIDLRDLLDDELIYNPARFQGVTLNFTTRELLFTADNFASGVSGDDMRRLNRMLLEDAFEEIESHQNFRAGMVHDFVEKQGLPDIIPHPYTLTFITIIAALTLVALSPVGKAFGEIAGQAKSRERAGSDSSVDSRDRWERRFGLLLLLIIAVAAFETLPVLVDHFHLFLVTPDQNWNTIFTTIAGGSVAIMGAAGKILSMFSGLLRKLAMLFIALLGVLAPLIVVLYVTRFLVYPPPIGHDSGTWFALGVILFVPALFVVFLIAAMIFGKIRGALTWREVFRMFLFAVALGVGTYYAVIYLTEKYEPDDLEGWGYFVVFVLAIELWLYCRIVIDINWTSIHGLYRDRLASAYLVGRDTKGDVAIEEDINLFEIGQYEKGSTAPYHLVNTTLNLQASEDPSLRDRNSDFFLFSKRFVGSDRTGYCRSTTLEQVHPQMNLATAMAISAAAASPNMGRATSPAMVAFMVMLNIRLGYWLPNPGRLERELSRGGFRAAVARSTRRLKRIALFWRKREKDTSTPGFQFREVFDHELGEIQRRWDNAYLDQDQRNQRVLGDRDDSQVRLPTTDYGIVGIGFSGGGIRSATINLGIAQALHDAGVFDHIDFMSTVSGGGYLGASISTLMRQRPGAPKPAHGKASFHTDPFDNKTEIEGVAHISKNARDEDIVIVKSEDRPDVDKEYRFLRFDQLAIKHRDHVKAGQHLIEQHNALWDRFKWRVKPQSLLKEMLMRLDETHKWVNLSDGGHIENLGGIELLRRRCKYIIIGDGEADPQMSFNGLATLIRYARIDLGIKIEIDTSPIRTDKSQQAIDERKTGLSKQQWAVGTITYPADEKLGLVEESGKLLYLKSSVTGKEDEVINEYRHRHPSFPHQSTADQMFDEDQFECYRALGQGIAEAALAGAKGKKSKKTMSYPDFCKWIEGLK